MRGLTVEATEGFDWLGTDGPAVGVSLVLAYTYLKGSELALTAVMCPNLTAAEGPLGPSKKQ